MEPLAQTYTVDEIAVLLKISRPSAYQAVRRGEIPSLKIGKRVLIPRRAFERLLEGQHVALTNGGEARP